MAAKIIALRTIVVIGSLMAGSPLPAWGAHNAPPVLDSVENADADKPAMEHVVEIHGMRFQTKELAVNVGDTVTWINKDIVPHTATALDDSWDSGRLNKGESFTLTITDETSLAYFCFYHRQMKASMTFGEDP